MGKLDCKALDQLVAEATVDCYNDSECATALYTVIDEKLAMPFKTTVLGIEVVVKSVDQGIDDSIVAICARGRERQRIAIEDLPLPEPAPKGAKWIAAYRHWLEQM